MTDRPIDLKTAFDGGKIRGLPKLGCVSYTFKTDVAELISNYLEESKEGTVGDLFALAARWRKSAGHPTYDDLKAELDALKSQAPKTDDRFVCPDCLCEYDGKTPVICCGYKLDTTAPAKVASHPTDETLLQTAFEDLTQMLEEAEKWRGDTDCDHEVGLCACDYFGRKENAETTIAKLKERLNK